MSSLSELKGNYVIDPAHSRMGFSARHATAQLDGDNPAASRSTSPSRRRASIREHICAAEARYESLDAQVGVGGGESD
jgi:hypothetical protein